MKIKSKLMTIIAIISMMSILFVSCQSKEITEDSREENNDKKLKIVTTLFPQYDFTRQLVGDKADITLLVKPGVETHSYEPTSEDIIKINKANMFVYTGKYMEAWSNKILDSLTTDSLIVTDVSKGINLDKSKEEDHKEEEESENHSHEYDPHIWTSPENAKKMVDNILKDLIKVDPENSEYYTENANKYKEELTALSNSFKTAVNEGKRKSLLFGGRFAMHYFTKEYDLDHKSAYDGCSTESEPSAEVLSNIIKEVKEKNIPVVYYEELVDPKIARTISEESGAEMLLLHTCHNLSDEDMRKGATYLSLMKQNLENLKKGLN